MKIEKRKRRRTRLQKPIDLGRQDCTPRLLRSSVEWLFLLSLSGHRSLVGPSPQRNRICRNPVRVTPAPPGL